ncbi:hypothetical protein [Kribbella sp. VKM Ac-2568]|nr:hypothetical protein [Kribbella sp. VKM Ac-2568]
MSGANLATETGAGYFKRAVVAPMLERDHFPVRRTVVFCLELSIDKTM